MNTNLVLLSQNETGELYVMVYSMYFHVIFTVTWVSSKETTGLSPSTERFLMGL